MPSKYVIDLYAGGLFGPLCKSLAFGRALGEVEFLIPNLGNREIKAATVTWDPDKELTRLLDFFCSQNEGWCWRTAECYGFSDFVRNLSPSRFTYQDVLFWSDGWLQLLIHLKDVLVNGNLKIKCATIVNCSFCILKYRTLRRIKPRFFSFQRFSLASYQEKDFYMQLLSRKRDRGRKLYCLISATYDAKLVMEANDRQYGVPQFYLARHDMLEEFCQMKRFVLSLDRIAAQTDSVKLILFSKKAISWSDVLQSDFVDLRNFEQHGLSLAEAIWICAAVSDLHVAFHSSARIFFSGFPITTLNFGDNSKDINPLFKQSELGVFLKDNKGREMLQNQILQALEY